MTQILLAVVFAAAGGLKLVGPKKHAAENRHFSVTQIRLLGLAEVLGAIGLIAPTVTGIAPFLSRVAAVCLATLMGGAVATRASQRKPATFPAVVALLLIAVATLR